MAWRARPLPGWAGRGFGFSRTALGPATAVHQRGHSLAVGRRPVLLLAAADELSPSITTHINWGATPRTDPAKQKTLNNNNNNSNETPIAHIGLGDDCRIEFLCRLLFFVSTRTQRATEKKTSHYSVTNWRRFIGSTGRVSPLAGQWWSGRPRITYAGPYALSLSLSLSLFLSPCVSVCVKRTCDSFWKSATPASATRADEKRRRFARLPTQKKKKIIQSTKMKEKKANPKTKRPYQWPSWNSVLPSFSFTEFYWLLPSFIGVLWILLGFTWFYWVLLGFTGFYWVSLSFTEFYWVARSSNGLYQVLSNFIEFY